MKVGDLYAPAMAQDKDLGIHMVTKIEATRVHLFSLNRQKTIWVGWYQYHRVCIAETDFWLKLS